MQLFELYASQRFKFLCWNSNFKIAGNFCFCFQCPFSFIDMSNKLLKEDQIVKLAHISVSSLTIL